MGKATRRKERPLIQPLDGPTPEQIARGGYAREDFIHADLGQRVTAHINRGGTSLARWRRDNKLSQSQIAAIEHCQRLWNIVGIKQKVTASYGERIPGGGDEEHRALVVLDARDDLHRIIDHFPGPLRKWFQVFELVCRFDVPAGVAGSELGYSNRANEERANTIVRFVADIIASKEKI